MMPETPRVAVDCVVSTPSGIVLIRRKHAPYQDAYALPGGFVEIGESTEAACRREIREETSLELDEPALVGVYSEPDRDPRGHVISVSYFARAGAAGLRAGDDAAWAELIRDPAGVPLAFDHARIIAHALALFGGED